MVFVLPVDAWTEATFQQVVADATQESLTIEFKAALSLLKPAEKREAAKDISAMANAAGGWILYGIAEGPGPGGVKVATAVAPIVAPSGAIAQQLEDVVHGQVVPPPSIRVREIPATGGVLVIVRVEASTTTLHMLSQEARYYRRTDKAARRMEEPELSQAWELIARRRLGMRELIAKRIDEEQKIGVGGFQLSIMPHTLSESLFDPAGVERFGPLFEVWPTEVRNALRISNHGFDCDVGDGYWRGRVRRDAGISVAFQACFDGKFHVGMFFLELVHALTVARRLWRQLSIVAPCSIAVRTSFTGEFAVSMGWGNRGFMFPGGPRLTAPLAFDLEEVNQAIRENPLAVAQRVMDRVFQALGEARCPYFAVDGAVDPSLTAREQELARDLRALVS